MATPTNPARQSLSAMLLASALLATPAAAQQLSVTSNTHITPVVELFTSEGCSSCPTADRWLSELGDAIDAKMHAVPLAFHVDYWDYLGWKDAFSKPEYTARQKQVAKANFQRSIYTPEFTVGGREARGAPQIIQSIQYANTQKAEVAIALNLSTADTSADHLDAKLDLDNRYTDGHATVYVAVYENHIVRHIEAGENRGKTLEYDFVVKYWSKPLLVKRGQSTQALQIQLPQDAVRQHLGVAIVVMDAVSGSTLQAVNTSLQALYQQAAS